MPFLTLNTTGIWPQKHFLLKNFFILEKRHTFAFGLQHLKNAIKGHVQMNAFMM